MNSNPNETASLSQAAMIERDLWAGHKITQLDAITKYLCTRLASRIADLKRKGVPISTEMVKVGQYKRVARYSISPEERHSHYLRAHSTQGRLW